jgi:hypothetical protein
LGDRASNVGAIRRARCGLTDPEAYESLEEYKDPGRTRRAKLQQQTLRHPERVGCWLLREIAVIDPLAGFTLLDLKAGKQKNWKEII